jgi:hypothetical protein
MKVKNENRSESMEAHVADLLDRGYERVDVRVSDKRHADDSIAEFHAIFSTLHERDCWKHRISKCLDIVKVEAAAAAIAFMTGSETYSKTLVDGVAHIYAPGYYETIGA